MKRLLILLATVALLVGALLALAACGGKDNKNKTPTATPQMATGEPTMAPGETTAPGATEPEPTDTGPFQGAQTPVEGTIGSGTPDSQQQPTLVDVRTAQHDGYDRIVFEFSGGAATGYSVQYVTDPTDCGSGQATFPSGGSTAYLQVRFNPAAAHDINTGQPTFGSQGISPNLLSIKNAKQSCDFEAVLTWVVQVNAQADFRVIELSGPTRLAVDVAQP